MRLLSFVDLWVGYVVAGVFGASAACSVPAGSLGRHEVSLPTVLVQVDGGWRLLHGGEPYVVKGAGGTTRLGDLARFGANTIRTWDGEGIGPLMDEAHAHGLKVVVGIWLGHERHGFNYDDPERRQWQLDRVRRIVLELKDHPALLFWAAGNEVEIEVAGEEARERALRSIDEAAGLIKELDPGRPVMAVVSELGVDGEKVLDVEARCANIDIIGINAYGGAANLWTRYRDAGLKKPYILTEFGPVGPWEVDVTPWGAPYEPHSSAKAGVYRKALEENWPRGARAELSLGAFAFYWGHKQEATETWFGLLLPSGEKTQAVEELSAYWEQRDLQPQSPRTSGITLEIDHLAVEAGSVFVARAPAEDPNGDALAYEWYVKRESADRRFGGDREAVPEHVEGLVREASGAQAVIAAPLEPGAYRVYVVIRDSTGWAAAANHPFRVKSVR